MIDYYSHIISHVSQVFASCTRSTSYSLLNIVHVIVCVFCLTNQVWKILWVLCKTDLLLEKKKGDCLKSKFLGELGFKSWVCENHFISYSCIFFFQCFEERLHQILVIFKDSFFFTISIDQGYFSINRNCFKNFKGASIYFDQSKLIFDQSKIVNQFFFF